MSGSLLEGAVAEAFKKKEYIVFVLFLPFHSRAKINLGICNYFNITDKTSRVG
ncbi:MAG: hypothetical protein QMD13_07250 [Candidatus Bathyarchaeia archaeon]|nr:hypothetical protein [Candidatus Bathyarchaeia archaeon]